METLTRRPRWAPFNQLPSVGQAAQDPLVDVTEFVRLASIPLAYQRRAPLIAISPEWRPLYTPLHYLSGCKYGCPVLVRQCMTRTLGEVVTRFNGEFEYGIKHESARGHSLHEGD